MAVHNNMYCGILNFVYFSIHIKMVVLRWNAGETAIAINNESDCIYVQASTFRIR